MKKQFALFDGNNLGHIAFHRGKSIILKNKIKEYAKKHKVKESVAKKKVALKESDFPAVEGMMYTVFFRKLHKLFKIFKEHTYIICWDNPGSSEWRREIYPDYKVRRDYDTDPIWRVLFDGMDEIRKVLNFYPVHQEQIEKLEADDIMYVMSGELSKLGKVVIVSGDSDMIQAIQKFGVKVYHPIKDKYVEAPKNYDYCIFKAIKGDKADDIEGIVGYGDVKAARLAEDMYGEDFVDDIACPELNKEQQKKVLKNLRIIRIENNPNLKNIKVSTSSIEASKRIEFDKIKKFYFDHKLKSLIEDFDTVISIFT
jgi:5'-3' exonuclease